MTVGMVLAFAVPAICWIALGIASFDVALMPEASRVRLLVPGVWLVATAVLAIEFLQPGAVHHVLTMPVSEIL